MPRRFMLADQNLRLAAATIAVTLAMSLAPHGKLYTELRTASDPAWVMGPWKQRVAQLQIRSGVTCVCGLPFRNGFLWCSEICVLVTQLLCVPLSMKRVLEAIRQPRRHVRGSILSNGCTLMWTFLLAWVWWDRPRMHWTNTSPAGRQAQAPALRSSLRSKKSGPGGTWP